MPKTDNPRGPVSRNVLAALDKQLRRKVISFEALRLGAERAKELERLRLRGLREPPTGYDPAGGLARRAVEPTPFTSQ